MYSAARQAIREYGEACDRADVVADVGAHPPLLATAT